jgi:ATP-dependent RNA helicase RhlE
MVATDIAARGLDINRLPHVVNYELPNVPEDYVHRIGRTARAGQEGHAVSLVCVDELKLLRDIESLLKTEIEKEVIPGYEPDPRIKAEPVQKGRPQRSGGQRKGAPGGGRNKRRGGPPKNRGGQRQRSSGGKRRQSRAG